MNQVKPNKVMETRNKQRIRLAALAFGVLFSLFASKYTYGATFYSQGDGVFSTLTNWDDNQGGGGTDPLAGELTDGTNTFVIQDGHTITVDQDIDVAQLDVGQGTSGTLTIGNDATARSMIVQGPVTVNNGASFNVGAFSATHAVNIQGTITNNGTLDFYNSSSQVANLTLDGTFTISGSSSPQLANITFNTGNVITSVALDIEGSVTIETGGTFTGAALTHTVAGNWTENGSGSLVSTGTIELDASLVQSVTDAATFNNLTINGGGIVTLAGTSSDNCITVNGNFTLTNNTDVTSAARNFFRGDFTVDDGSTYTANDGRIHFDGSSAQAINIGSNATFDEVYFDNGGALDPKTITGEITANDFTQIYSDAQVDDGAASQNHTFEQLRMEGTCNFSGTITFTAGTLEDDDDGDFTLGTADIEIAGNVNIENGDILRVNGDFHVQSAQNFYVQNNASLIQESAGKTLDVEGYLHIRGTDNFPSGFDNITFGSSSIAYYNRSYAQTVRGNITYGQLRVEQNTKTVDGPVIVNSSLNLRNGVTLDLGAFSHTVTGTIINNNNSSLISTGAVLMNGGNQNIQSAGSGSYTFNDLSITKTAGSDRTNLIQDDLTINGALTITNPGGSDSNILTVDFEGNTLTNDGGDAINIGSYCRIRASGTSNFGNTLSSFSSSTLDANSIVRFDGAAQNIPSMTFGTIELRGSGVKTALGTLDIEGDLTRNDADDDFNDGGFNHTIAGDWLLDDDNTPSMSGTVTFDGTDQIVSESNFGSVIFSGSGTKTLNGDIDLSGDLTINDGVTVTASTRSINLTGDWTNSGTGIFTQTTGMTTFDGGSDQTVTSNATSYFGDFTINMSGGTLIAGSDLDVDLDFDFTQNNADFDLAGFTLYLERDWYFRSGCTFTHNNGTIHFDGSSSEQDIRNYSSSITYYNWEFSGAGEKQLENNDFNVDGNITINGGATFDALSRDINIAGDWSNEGTFQANNGQIVIFDGTDQNIGASTFQTIQCSNSGTKTLLGNITCYEDLTIDDGVTLDVSASNYSISIEDNWNNAGTGIFVPRNGTVGFNGNDLDIFTGGVGAGKQFYNVEFNPTVATNCDLQGAILIQNDVTINGGILRTGANNMTVGGNFTCNGTMNVNNNSSLLTLNASSGTKTFDPGTGGTYRDITIDATGAIIELQNELTLVSNRDFTLDNGTFDLNGNTLNLQGGSGILTVNGGTFDIDEGGELAIANGSSVTNAGGVFRVVGTSDTPATMTINGSGTYTFTQTSGTFHAQYYRIENTNTNGVDIQGGSIDATNNFSEGAFTGGTGNAYITLTGINLGGGTTATNTVFEANTVTYNCSRTSGTGTITFEDASGSLSGEINDEDPGTFVNWSFPSGFFWDGDAADEDWDNDLNWSGNTKPDGNANVYIDHTHDAGAFDVRITAADATTNRLTVDEQSGADIRLILENGFDLDVTENFIITAGAEVTVNDASSEISVEGNWSNSATFTAGSGKVVFDGSAGTHSISPGGDAFNDIEFNANGATYIISDDLDVSDEFTLTDGTVQVSSNETMNIGGNWTLSGGAFDPGTGTVVFNKDNAATQTISSGTFYNFQTDNSGGGTATKQLTGSIAVTNDLRIRANTILDGQNNIITVQGDWRNDVGASGFTQTGSGLVDFSGGNQNIGNSGSETTFNIVIFQGSGTKTLSENMTVNGDFSIVSGVGTVDVLSTTTVTGSGADNDFDVANGTLRIRGTSNFPTGFENISISGGTVEYYSNSDQDIYPTAYNNLTLRRINSGSNQTKTALGDFAVNGNLTLNDVNTTLDMGGFTVMLAGNLSIPSGGNQVTWSGGKLIHVGGGWNIDADITTLNDVDFLGSGTKRMFSNLSVSGDVEIGADVTLRMDDYTMTGLGTEQFTMTGACFLTCAIPATTGVAFPSGFGTYDLDVTSRVTLNDVANQTIFTTPTYGDFYLNTNGNATLDGNLDVNGDFIMNHNPTLVDAGFNMNFSGSVVNLEDYPSPTGTITFDGADQAIYNLDSTDPDIIYFNDVVFGGTGTKTMTNGQDEFEISGNFTLNSGVTINTTREWRHSGSTWANNGGSFSHTANIVVFNGTGAQSIDPGASNNFHGIQFSDTGAKTINNNGLDIDDGGFTIDNNVTVDMGALTHYIETQTPSLGTGITWTTSNASFVFDRTGDQSIPSFTVVDLTFSGSGDKDLTGDITADDITIDASADLDAISNYTITVTGNWTNNGDFVDRTSTVAFESNDTNAKTITGNGDAFYNVTFNQTQTNTRTYTLLDDVTIAEDLTIGNGATLDLNSNNLTLGDNDSPNSVETHSIELGGTLEIDENAVLYFDGNDGGDPSITVNGTLNILGTSGNNAQITRSAGSNRLDLDILSGGTIGAQYYHIQYLVDDGLDVQSGATIDNTNNFSNGTWSNINTAGGAAKRYLIVEADVTGLANVENVTFNHGGTPTIGVHYNVQRSGGAGGTLTFDGSINGLLGGETYEDDGGSKIAWPPATTLVWTGSTSTDWFTGSNWTPAGPPNGTTDITIPLVSNNPIIDGANATCKGMNITDGILQVLNGYDLTVVDDVNIGSTGSGILAVGDPNCGINVGGSWSVGTNDNFVHGDGTVSFTASSGSVTISPSDNGSNDFYNVIFNGGATFNIDEPNIDFDGSITIANGTVTPTANNYTWTVGGDINNTGGAFATTTNGTITLDGADQDLTDVTLRAMTAAGTGTKTMNGTVSFQNAVNVTSTLAAAGGATLDMDGDVTIDGLGTFNDGGGSHTFAGQTWTGTGSYAGSGTVTFDRTGTQYIAGGNFHNLTISGSNGKYLSADVDITGDLYISNSIGNFFCETYLIDNTSGTGTMTVEDGEYVYVEGTDNFPSGFATYALDPGSFTRYWAATDQTIRSATYGNLQLDNATTKQLGGDIIVLGDITFNEATLDVTSNDYQITVGDDWDNDGTGSFTARNGDVIFNGTGQQDIRSSVTGTKDFYRVTVNGTGNEVRVLHQDPTIGENLRALNGTFNANGFTVTVGGDLTATSGTFSTSGEYNLTKASGSASIQSNGSTFLDLTINSGGTYTALDDITLNGDFTLTAGTFDGNSNTITLGNGVADIHNIAGTYAIGAGGTLAIGNTSSFNVGSTGRINVVGTSGNIATVTSSSANRYNFTVSGTIAAEYYLFEYMSSSGINIDASGTIDATNHFSNGTFQNVQAGGTALTIDNSQTFNEGSANRIENVAFPVDPGAGAFNVTKNVNSGNLEFYNATGDFAGESLDGDLNNRIEWTGPITLTWDGSSSDDWFTAANWTPSSGPDIIPTSDYDVIIANVATKPVIGSNGAITKNLTIDAGAILKIETADNGADLTVNGDFELNGTLQMVSDLDSLLVGGNWDRGGSGALNPGSGFITFNASSGAILIDQGSDAFYNLIIDADGSTISVDDNTEVDNNFTLLSGTFDVTANNRSLTVGEEYIASGGTFVARQGTVTLNSSTAGTVDFNPGSSAFYNLIITGGASTDFTLTGNDLSVDSDFTLNSGELNLGGRTFNMGDGSGTDNAVITGELEVNANANLLFGANAVLEVNSGGILYLRGTDDANTANVSRQSSGYYSIDINSGGEIGASYYQVDYIDTDGIVMHSGASINTSDYLSYGTFSNGESGVGSRYLRLENTFADFITTNVTFNSGPTYNISRVSGTGNITCEDCFGGLGGYLYEEDDLDATAGLVRWGYTSPIITWDPTTTDWHTASNWNDGLGGGFVPLANTNVFIPNTGTNPVISSSDAVAGTVTINVGAELTIQSDRDLTITEGMSNAGTLTISGGSATTISAESWSNTGSFSHGGSSTVELTGSGGTFAIQTNGDPFCGLTLNSTTGDGVFQPNSAVDVDCNFTITDGTYEITNASHSLTIGGDWSVTADGTYTNGGSDVTFDGTGAQNIDMTSGDAFNSVTFGGSGTKTLATSIDVDGDLTINSTLSAAANTINVAGNWTNTGTFTYGTSTVVLDGSSPQSITASGGENFYNLTLNNTSVTFPQFTLNDDITVTSNGTFTLTDGVLETSISDIITLENNAGLGGAPTSSSYIDGPIIKEGSGDFVFPVGDGSIFAALEITGVADASGSFRAQYFDSGSPDSGDLGANISHVSGIEYWDITRASGTSTPFVTLYWEDGTRSEVSNLSDLKVAHFEGGQWENMGGSTSGTTDAGTVTSTSIFSSFSPVSLMSEGGANPLPVELLSFEAVAEEGQVSLEWQTASEKDNDYFVVERSDDGDSFEELVMVEGAGNSSTIVSYRAQDVQPLIGKSYYRIKQVDFDGTINYSELRSVDIRVNNYHLKLFPNPSAKQDISLEVSGLESNEVISVKITDIMGNDVITENIEADYSGSIMRKLGTADLKSGTYAIVIKTSQGEYKEKLIVL